MLQWAGISEFVAIAELGSFTEASRKLGLSTAQAIEDNQLVTLLEQFQEPDEGIWAVYPPNRHLSPKVRVLVDLLTEQLPHS
ncbi:LysR family transcriptional regulator [Parendozoicomonas sp. Alg238-R29]|uniref:LysR family transcriptional regulator n=1 Tax=Parendozoicomonas sp. Alg238-R29 TaxID=2993446 RepID=UPI00248EEEC8|nr:LysR family transcriptional regulator [Parendozoicomonas sp. Alg238-R29]